MPMIVSKFGGSATASAQTIKNVVNISKNHNRKILVFSAIGKEYEYDTKTTDLLFEYTKANENDKKRIELQVVEKFKRLKSRLNIEYNVESEWKQIFYYFKISQDKNFLVSRGEFTTSKMMAKALNMCFVPAEKFFYFKDEKIDYPKTKQALENYLKAYKRIAVPGFYGIDEKDKIVLLSRGGSDVSAAIFALVTHADKYENWTDVDGVYEKDPRIEKSKQIKHMNYDQLCSLTENGAKVIHKDCAKILKGTDISLIVRSILDPHATPTIISEGQKFFQKE